MLLFYLKFNLVLGNIIAFLVFNFMSHKEDGVDVVPQSAVTILFWVYLGVCLVSSLSFFFLAEEKYSCVSFSLGSHFRLPPTESTQDLNLVQRIFSAVTLLRDPRMLLLAPLIIYSGWEQGFIFVNFTSDIVSKAVGPIDLCLVVMTYGIVNVVASFVLGKVGDRFGNGPVVMIGWITHALFLGGGYVVYRLHFVDVTFFHDTQFALYIAAGFYSLGDAAIQLVVPVILGQVFLNDVEAAFSDLKFFQSAGNSIISFVGKRMDFSTKLLASYAILCVALLAYMGLRRYKAPTDKTVNDSLVIIKG